jgi:WD40 repeat protein
MRFSASKGVAFSTNGSLLAAGSDDGSMQLWDVSNPQDPVHRSNLTGPGESVISIAFSAKSTLAAAADDDSIYLWGIQDPAAPARLATFSGLDSPVSIAWLSGATLLLGVASDGTPLTWDVNPNDIARRICRTSKLQANAEARITPYLQDITYQPVCP